MIIGINGRVGSGKDTVGRIIQYLIRDKQNDGFSTNVKLQDTLNLTESDPYHSGWEIKKFAAKLKQVASLLTGIPVEKFEDQEFKKTFLSSDWVIEHKESTQKVRVEVIPDALREGLKFIEPVKYTTCGGVTKVEMVTPVKVDSLQVRVFLQRLGTEAIRDGIHPNTWVNALFADYKPRHHHTVNPDFEDPNWIITDCRFPNEAQAIKDRGGIVIRVTRPGENLADLHPSETSLDAWTFDFVLDNSGSITQLKDNVAFFLHTNRLL